MISFLSSLFGCFKDIALNFTKKNSGKSFLKSLKLLAQPLQNVSDSVQSKQNYLETVSNHPKHTKSEVYSSKIFSKMHICQSQKLGHSLFLSEQRDGVRSTLLRMKLMVLNDWLQRRRFTRKAFCYASSRICDDNVARTNETTDNNVSSALDVQ